MLFKWLDASEATQVGTALANDFYLQSSSGLSKGARREPRPALRQELQRFLQQFLQQVDRAARPLKLNVFKRAKLANSFKWRLLEQGVEAEIVEELTRALVLRLSGKPASALAPNKPSRGAARRATSVKIQALLEKGTECIARGAAAEAIDSFQELLSLDPSNVFARNNLAAALSRLGRYREAEDQLRRATLIRPAFADAHANLGAILRWKGRTVESETHLRRALKLQPTHVDAHINLSTTVLLLGHLREAKGLFEKALRLAPRNVAALVGLGHIAEAEGRLDEAETLYKRALDVDPKAYEAWAALVWARKMTPADGDWLKRAEEIAGSGLAPFEEASIRYAMGKYCDDVGDYARAFRNFQRANELQKMSVQAYDRDSRTRFVDDVMRVYTREALADADDGAVDSERPVFVVGMPRSGTSLVEQIIASHPAARGAGELGFWSEAVQRREAVLRQRATGRDTEKAAGSRIFQRAGRAFRGCAARRRQDDVQLRLSRGHSCGFSAGAHDLSAT